MPVPPVCRLTGITFDQLCPQCEAFEVLCNALQTHRIYIHGSELHTRFGLQNMHCLAAGCGACIQHM